MQVMDPSPVQCAIEAKKHRSRTPVTNKRKHEALDEMRLDERPPTERAEESEAGGAEGLLSSEQGLADAGAGYLDSLLLDDGKESHRWGVFVHKMTPIKSHSHQ